MARWFLKLAVIVLLTGIGAPAADAETVSVRASKNDDFGRIVFLWDRPVTYELSHDGSDLTIRFGRAIDASYQRVLGALSKYIDRVRRGADGRSVSFRLKGNFETYGFDSGNAVIVEIAEPQQPAPPRQPQTAETGASASRAKAAAQSVPAKDLPKIRVRTGAHEAYTRVVFDWPKAVKYTVSQAGGVVTLKFQAAANIQLGRISRNPPRYLGGVRQRAANGETTVTLAIPASSKIKHFLSGPKVVLDVQRPSGAEEIAALPPEAPPPAAEPAATPEAAPAAAENAEAAKTAAQPPAAAAETPATAPAKPKVESEQLAQAAQGEAGTPAPAAGDPKPAAATAAGQQTAQQGAQQAVQQAAQQAAAPAALAVSGQPLALKPVERAPVKKGEEEEGEGEGKELSPEEAAKEAAKKAAAGVKFQFDWTEPVAAAVFRRAGYVWVIFDKASRIDVQSLLAAGGTTIQSIDQAPSPKATVLRIKVSRRINPLLSRKGLSWILRFQRRDQRASVPIEIKAQPDSPVGARVFMPVPEPGQPVGITDPAIGDNLVVVPVIPLGHGVRDPYTYAQLRVLPSAQGIVIQPLVDDLRVRPLRQGVELTSGSKLAISPVSADIAASAKLSAARPLTKIFELDQWELKSLADFNERKQELQRDLAVSRGAQREAKRFNLARFYFSNRFAAEALGVLAQMKLERKEVEDDPEYRLIRGGASYLMGRLADAATDFTHESLDGTDEANFWRAAVVAASGDMLAAAPELKRTGVVTKKYPRALKILMGTIVADAAVEIGDIKTAKDFIEALRALKPKAAEVAEIDFVEGRLLELGGDTDGAVTKWEEVQESRNRNARAKATIARMELLLKLERMSVKEAIEDLEKLRFAWRGDEFEFDLLRRLGGLYLDEGVYRNGLQALRQAATYFRDHEEAPQVTQQMADVFNALYLEDGADTMPAVTAIAVYEEFKELTPAGAKGDEMIRKLADRLAGVDLLDQAAEILEGQVRFRLKGTLKAEVGARLAVVYLLARHYDRALAALDATNEVGQPDPLVIQRRHLKARALMGLDRKEDALELLKKDKSPDADLLRAEAFWNTGDWSHASNELRKVLRASGAKKDEPLTQDQAERVLNYAISLVLSGNERALAKVRREYGRAVESTDLKDAFRLVSAPTALGLISPGSVQTRVKLAENFKTFMSAYKKRLKEQGLSGLTSQEAAAAISGGGEPETKGG